MSRLSPGARRWRRAVGSLAVSTLAMALAAVPASAGPGYQLAAQPSFATSADVPIGLAVDQASQNLYVAELTDEIFETFPGQVEKFSGLGSPSGAFSSGGEDFFIAVAVNPVTQDVYAFQGQGSTPNGQKGKPQVNVFSSAGALKTTFTVANALSGTVATDAAGRLFFPNSISDVVQIYSAVGALEGSISCAGCSGGGFSEPIAVAFDSAGRLYVVDRANEGRVVRFAPSGGSYVYESTLQSGTGASAIAVDTSSDDVLVGNRVGQDFHITAYAADGTEFDDFGAGLVTAPSFSDVIIGQLAVNATTRRIYASDPGGNRVWVFDRIASIPAPTASVLAPAAVGQLEATLRASVETKGHVLTSCRFEYTDDADFKANGYANATTAPCPAVVGSSGSTTVTAAIGGLTPAATYHYRLLATDHGGSAETGTQVFQALPPLPPEATTGSVSAITKNSATLMGTVNPKGGLVSDCHFEYVSEAIFQLSGFAGATSKPCSSLPSGTTPTSVLVKVTGLAAGTKFHVRIVATNNSGTTAAAEKTFSTVAESCAENPTFCPLPESPPAPPVEPGATPPPTTPAPRKPLRCRKGFKKKKVRGKLKCVKVKKRLAQR